MGSHAEGAAFVGCGDEPEQLSSGVVERWEAELVNDDGIVAEQDVDHTPDGVVGQAAVGRFDEVGGGEIGDPLPGFRPPAMPRATSVLLMPVPAPAPVIQMFSCRAPMPASSGSRTSP